MKGAELETFSYIHKPKKGETLKDRPVPKNLPRGSDDPIGSLIADRMGW